MLFKNDVNFYIVKSDYTRSKAFSWAELVKAQFPKNCVWGEYGTNNLNSLIVNAGEGFLGFGTSFEDEYIYPSNLSEYCRDEKRPVERIIMDQFNRVIPPSFVIDDIIDLLKDGERIAERDYSVSYYYKRTNFDYPYRCAAEPHINNKSWRRGCIRENHYIQEQRLSEPHKEYTRGKRRNANKLFNWEFTSKSRSGNNWKRYRKTQWKSGDRKIPVQLPDDNWEAELLEENHLRHEQEIYAEKFEYTPYIGDVRSRNVKAAWEFKLTRDYYDSKYRMCDF